MADAETHEETVDFEAAQPQIEALACLAEEMQRQGLNQATIVAVYAGATAIIAHLTGAQDESVRRLMDVFLVKAKAIVVDEEVPPS